MDKLHAVKEGKQAQGKNEYIKYLEGGKLTLRQAVKGKCYDCMGYYEDGKVDCVLPDCPLYPFMPFNPNKQKSRVVSQEQKDTAKARFASARKLNRQATEKQVSGKG